MTGSPGWCPGLLGAIQTDVEVGNAKTSNPSSPSAFIGDPVAFVTFTPSYFEADFKNIFFDQS